MKCQYRIFRQVQRKELRLYLTSLDDAGGGWWMESERRQAFKWHFIVRLSRKKMLLLTARSIYSIVREFYLYSFFLFNHPVTHQTCILPECPTVVTRYIFSLLLCYQPRNVNHATVKSHPANAVEMVSSVSRSGITITILRCERFKREKKEDGGREVAALQSTFYFGM